jgi:hypothetical protein
MYQTILEWEVLASRATKYAEELGILNEDGECDEAKIDEIRDSWLKKT